MPRLFHLIIIAAALVLSGIGSVHAQFDNCGDFNLDGSLTVSDLTGLVEYLYDNGPAPDSLHLMNMDGHPGINMADVAQLILGLFVDQDPSYYSLCRETVPYPIQEVDTVVVRNTTVPSGVAGHAVEVWYSTGAGLKALSFPFTYACSTGNVQLDSILFDPIDQVFRQAGLIDSTADRGLLAFTNIFELPPEKTRLARLFFTLGPRPFPQTVEIDTTEWPGGHRFVSWDEDSRPGYADFSGIPRLYGTPSTPTTPPSCCEGYTGDVNASGDPASLTDLTLLVNRLFITFEQLDCPAEANADGDQSCLITLTDVTILVQYLFIGFPPSASCGEFDPFICQ